MPLPSTGLHSLLLQVPIEEEEGADAPAKAADDDEEEEEEEVEELKEGDEVEVEGGPRFLFAVLAPLRCALLSVEG